MAAVIRGQSVNRVHMGSAASWVDAKDQADTERYEQRQAYRPKGNSRFKRENTWRQQVGVNEKYDRTYDLK